MMKAISGGGQMSGQQSFLTQRSMENANLRTEFRTISKQTKVKKLQAPRAQMPRRCPEAEAAAKTHLPLQFSWTEAAKLGGPRWPGPVLKNRKARPGPGPLEPQSPAGPGPLVFLKCPGPAGPGPLKIRKIRAGPGRGPGEARPCSCPWLTYQLSPICQWY